MIGFSKIPSAVVCTTAVGAVDEAITDAETGFLLPRTGTRMIARETTRILQNLCHDRDMLRRIDPESVDKNGAVSDSAAETLSTHPLTQERIRILEEFDGGRIRS